MGVMKTIFTMFENWLSNQQVAWYLLRETKVSDWFDAKELANKMREDYDKRDDETSNEIMQQDWSVL